MAGFAQQTIAYTVSVPNATSSIAVKPATSNAFSTVTVNGTSVLAGQYSVGIALNVGTNLITTIVTAQDTTTTKTYKITVTCATGSLNAAFVGIKQPVENVPAAPEDDVIVHRSLSPNGDGANDVFKNDGITAFPDNRVTIINNNGVAVFEAQGYNNASKAFDGHSSKTGVMQQAGTYFYTIDYSDGKQMLHKNGCLVLKY